MRRSSWTIPVDAPVFTHVPGRRKQGCAHRRHRKWFEDGRRKCSDVTTGQGMPAYGKESTRFSPEASRKNYSSIPWLQFQRTQIGILASRRVTEETYVVLTTKFVVICYRSCVKLIPVLSQINTIFDLAWSPDPSFSRTTQLLSRSWRTASSIPSPRNAACSENQYF